MIAVSCGDLLDQVCIGNIMIQKSLFLTFKVLCSDGRKKCYNYTVTIPTSASNIGFVVGLVTRYRF